MKTLQQAIDELKEKANRWAESNLDSTVVYRCHWYAGMGVYVEVKTESGWVNIKSFMIGEK